MIHFEEYVREIESLAIAAMQGSNDTLVNVDLKGLLNGDVGRELRLRVPLAERQLTGAFFTGQNLRFRTIGPRFPSDISGPIWDPACGAGDLLLSYADKLDVLPDIGETLVKWGEKLFGNDIEDAFLRAAKARLVLAAYSRGSRKLNNFNITLDKIFPNICRKDSLLSELTFVPIEIILNPPFIPVIATKVCEWGLGRVSAAALFIDNCLRISAAGTRITAILPDVLRTGSRYARWRKFVLEFAEVVRIDVYGPFDPQVDVDVFILELKVREVRKNNTIDNEPWGVKKVMSTISLGDDCSISVGSVVPHRDAEVGNEYPFLHSKDATPWETIDHLESRRCFRGTIFHPPFVVIRRTSSPSDKFRAIGTIVNCLEPVAVENHLIVCKPYSGTLQACREILKTLQSEETNEWLNSRIRCRHLTVGAVREIPIKKSIKFNKTGKLRKCPVKIS